MKKILHYIFWIFVIFLGAFSLNAQTIGCISCHIELDDELKMPAEAFDSDIHNQFGLDCSSCHGGNPQSEDFEKAKDQTFRGIPNKKEIPDLCGSCHSDSLYMRKYNPSIRVDQLDIYRTSQHGQLLTKGDTKVAVCTDCHGVHGILPATHPKSKIFPWNIPDTCSNCHSNKEYMEAYGIPTDQNADYRMSVHAHALFEKKDLSAPVCNDCHGNHGAFPPELSSISYVCHQCHPSAADLFSQSPHKQAFDDLEISECEACHGNHKIIPPTDEMLGTGEGSTCIECHDESSKAYSIADKIKQILDSYKQRMETAELKLDKADKQGVEVSEARFQLQEATTLLIQSRNLTHSISLEKIAETVAGGEEVLDRVLTAGDAALKEAQNRKIGLIIATFFLALLATGLVFKIKQLNKKNE